MRVKKKRNQNKNILIKKIEIIMIVLMIVCTTVTMLKRFNDTVTPKVLKVSKQKANEEINNVITNNINNYVLNDSKLLEKIINITKNNSNEIIMVDFDLKNAYMILKNVTKCLNDNLKLNEKKSGIYLEIPIGYYFNSSFFNNYGPKIPIKIDFAGNVLSNLKTKLYEYGMNNVLVELYANLVIVEEVITPVSNNIIKISYDILLASKLINGKIPSYYGNGIEKESKIFDVSK